MSRRSVRIASAFSTQRRDSHRARSQPKKVANSSRGDASFVARRPSAIAVRAVGEAYGIPPSCSQIRSGCHGNQRRSRPYFALRLSGQGSGIYGFTISGIRPPPFDRARRVRNDGVRNAGACEFSDYPVDLGLLGQRCRGASCSDHGRPAEGRRKRLVNPRRWPSNGPHRPLCGPKCGPTAPEGKRAEPQTLMDYDLPR